MNLSIPLLHVQEYSKTFYNKLITIKIENKKISSRLNHSNT